MRLHALKRDRQYDGLNYFFAIMASTSAVRRFSMPFVSEISEMKESSLRLIWLARLACRVVHPGDIITLCYSSEV